MTTPTSPTRYQVELEAFGYAIGQLLKHTSFHASRALRDATVAFLIDAGIDFAAMPEQDKEVLFRNVGRGYAARPEKEQKPR